jgi:hypothetical protein
VADRVLAADYTLVDFTLKRQNIYNNLVVTFRMRDAFNKDAIRPLVSVDSDFLWRVVVFGQKYVINCK